MLAWNLIFFFLLTTYVILLAWISDPKKFKWLGLSKLCYNIRTLKEKMAVCEQASKQPGLIKMCTSVHFFCTVFTYITARFTAVSKRNVHWVALKHRFNTWNLAHLYYVDIGTYCCVFIKLFRNVLRRFRIQISGDRCYKFMFCRVGNMPYTKPIPKPTR